VLDGGTTSRTGIAPGIYHSPRDRLQATGKFPCKGDRDAQGDRVHRDNLVVSRRVSGFAIPFVHASMIAGHVLPRDASVIS
jgi:hypothetical protein